MTHGSDLTQGDCKRKNTGGTGSTEKKPGTREKGRNFPVGCGKRPGRAVGEGL